MSIYNFVQAPENNIFINYEEFLRQSLNKYFVDLNELHAKKHGIKFEVSNNDINWIEIHIPPKL